MYHACRLICEVNARISLCMHTGRYLSSSSICWGSPPLRPHFTESLSCLYHLEVDCLCSAILMSSLLSPIAPCVSFLTNTILLDRCSPVLSPDIAGLSLNFLLQYCIASLGSLLHQSNFNVSVNIHKISS